MRTLFLFIGLSCFGLQAQQVNLDSLWGVWKDESKADSVRLMAIDEYIGRGYLYIMPDTAFELLKLQIDFAKKASNNKYYAGALNSMGITHAIKARYDSASHYFNSCLIFAQKTHDEILEALCYQNLALIQEKIGNPDIAFKSYLRCHEIYLEHDDKKKIAHISQLIGKYYKKHAIFDSALFYYNESLRIWSELNDRENVVSVKNNLGNLYLNQGQFNAAEKLFKESLSISKEIGDYQGQLSALSGLGNLTRDYGDYSLALKYFFMALEIAESITDPGSEAKQLNNIGVVYLDQGNYEQSEKYLRKCLEMNEQMNHQGDIASALGNLGILSKLKGDTEKSLSFYKRAMDIHMRIGHEMEAALVQHNIGTVYQANGDIKKALSFQLTSLETAKKHGANRFYSRFLNNIAVLYRISADYDNSIKFGENALFAVNELGMSEEKRFVLRNLFLTYACLDSTDKCIANYVQLNDQLLKDIQVNYFTLTTEQKEKYYMTIESDFDLIMDFSLNYPELEEATSRTYNNSLTIKALMLKSTTAMRNAILSSMDSTLIDQYYGWIALKRQIAKAYSEGGDVTEFEEQANELEKELVKRSQEFSDIKKIQELTWKDVQSGLKEGESAIEFVRFTHQEDYRNDSNKVQLYAALIIDSDCDHPTMVRLFEESELEKILGTFPGNNLSYIEQVYGTKENTKSQLYDLIWKPMEETLGDAKKVYVSPVGLLHKISFAALAKEQDVFMCDLYDIEMKSSTGKLAVPDDISGASSPSSSVGSSVTGTTTLFGGIDYNSDSTSTQIWNYLDGSLSETQQISKILKKGNVDFNYFKHGEATEAQFKEMASKSNILHIATHGFFYPDPDKVLDEMIDIEETEEPINFRGGRTGVGVNTFVKSRNPLMRSGLAFAGANDVWNRQAIDGEDGVLTAAEVATIDMRNTDLVVLSACETGLGDIKGSEGVYGLQRSFKMAGVHYLIMSLWQVPDKETAEFMTTFYKYLTKSNDIKSSFNQTQKDMRKKYDPYYWGAFVLIE